MTTRSWVRWGRGAATWIAMATVAAGVAGCGEDVADGGCVGASCSPSPSVGAGGATPGSEGPSGLVADFSLVDVNATSTTAGEPVSPRDYLQRVSAWYFAHAT